MACIAASHESAQLADAMSGGILFVSESVAHQGFALGKKLRGLLTISRLLVASIQPGSLAVAIGLERWQLGVLVDTKRETPTLFLGPDVAGLVDDICGELAL
jgi:hypothetical protein